MKRKIKVRTSDIVASPEIYRNVQVETFHIIRLSRYHGTALDGTFHWRRKQKILSKETLLQLWVIVSHHVFRLSDLT